MKNPIVQTLCLFIALGSLVAVGCSGNTGIVEPPVVSAEQAAANEARQAAYSQSMAKAYAKRKPGYRRLISQRR